MDEQIINKTYFGSDLKLKITVNFGENDPNTDFDVILTIGTKQAVLNKSQLIKVDEKTYLACVKAPETTRGKVNVYIKAHFADLDFEDGIHDIVRPAIGDIKII